MKVTTLEQIENGLGRVATKLNQYASKTELAGKLDSTGKAETAGTADNAIRDGEGNVISSTYLKKSDNVGVDLSDYQTAAQADAKYLGKTDTAANSEKATKDGQNRNIADTYITKDEASSTYLAKTALNVISTIPSQNGSVTYDGTAKTPAWLNYDTLKLQISGDYQNKINAGTYQTGFKPISPYTWTNGSQTVQTANWTIGKAAGRLSLSAESGSVNIDATKTFTVNRAGDGVITVTSSNSNIATAAVSGNTVTITGKAAGSATITVKVAEGTNHFAPANKTFNVTVNKIPLNLSASISSAVTYNLTGTINISGNTGGGAVTASSANSSCVTVSSTTTGTVTVKCANYSAAATQITINVAETTKYTSGTTTCNVTTAKATPTLTLSAEAVELTSSYTTATVTVTTNSTGTLSATPSDSFSCSTAVNEKTISISALSHATAFVVVTVDESNNFLAMSKNVSVDTRIAAINMLKGRTLAQLQAIIKNGQALNYFQVGDYFDFTFSYAISTPLGATIPANSTWRAVCIGINHNPSIEGYNRVHFAITKNTANKDIYFYGRYINDSSTSEDGWQGCVLRTWLNNTFYNALPTDLKNVISTCTKYTNNVGASNLESSVTPTSDKIFIFADYEVDGDNSTESNDYERTKQQQYEWYANGNGKKPVCFDENFDSFGVIPTRSPVKDSANFFCSAFNNDYAKSYGMDEAAFIPCFTIA